MTDVRKHATPEAEHLAERGRLLAGLTEQLSMRETGFTTTGASFARYCVHYLRH